MLEDSKRDQTMGQAGQTAGQGTEMQTKNLLTKRAKKPAYLQSLNESEKAENFKIIDNMNKKISYLKNPRHKVNKAPILMTVVSYFNSARYVITDTIFNFYLIGQPIQARRT
jgi:hypothetical protein